jgi:hypothetical protein
MDRHDEANSHYTQFCERATEVHMLFEVVVVVVVAVAVLAPAPAAAEWYLHH